MSGGSGAMGRGTCGKPAMNEQGSLTCVAAGSFIVQRGDDATLGAAPLAPPPPPPLERPDRRPTGAVAVTGAVTGAVAAVAAVSAAVPVETGAVPGAMATASRFAVAEQLLLMENF